MKYRRIPAEIDAEPYQPGKEAEQGVCTQLCSPFTPGATPPPSPHIHVRAGMQWLAPGDMIVSERGDRYVCPKNLFPKLYEECREEQPDALAPVVYDEAERLLREEEARDEAGAQSEEKAS